MISWKNGLVWINRHHDQILFSDLLTGEHQHVIYNGRKISDLSIFHDSFYKHLVDGKTCKEPCLNKGKCENGFCVCPNNYAGNYCQLSNEETKLGSIQSLIIALSVIFVLMILVFVFIYLNKKYYLDWRGKLKIKRKRQVSSTIENLLKRERTETVNFNKSNNSVFSTTKASTDDKDAIPISKDTEIKIEKRKRSSDNFVAIL